MRNKEVIFAQHDTAVIGSKTINVNDNTRHVEVANDNFAIAELQAA